MLPDLFGARLNIFQLIKDNKNSLFFGLFAYVLLASTTVDDVKG